jgi:hypothetical protein
VRHRFYAGGYRAERRIAADLAPAPVFLFAQARITGLVDVAATAQPVNGAGVESPSAPGPIRTADLSLRRRALYPLSYGRGSPSLRRV